MNDDSPASTPVGRDFPPLARLVPHEPPMLLIDEIVASHPPCTRVLARVRANNPMAEDGRVPALALLEIMAQSIAAAGGLERWLRGEPPAKGVLLGTRELDLRVEWLKVGDVIEVEVEKSYDDGSLASYACRAHRGAEELASGELNVMIERGVK